MGELIGSIGGLLAAILVILLIYFFLIDSSIIKKRSINVDLKKYLIGIIVLYLVQLFVCGIIHGFLTDNIVKFNNQSIWKNTIVFDKLYSNEIKYSLYLIIKNGNMPVYYYLVSFFGNLLFRSFNDFAFYISFLGGFTSYMILFHIIHDYLKSNSKRELLTLSLLIPGNIFLFLPTPFSVGMAFLFLFSYCLIHKKNKILLLLLSILSSLFHLIGIASIIIWLIYIIKDEISNYLILSIIVIVSVLLLILGFLFQWSNWYESIFILNVYSLFIGQKLINKSITNITKLYFIVLNAYLLFGILLNSI